MRGGPLGVTQNAADALAAEGETFVLDELLLKMGVVEASILAPRQIDNALTQFGDQGPGLGLPPVAMPHPVRGMGLEAAFEALHLAFAALQ